MAVKKTNDAQARQALDHEQPAGKLGICLLTAAQTHHVAAGIIVVFPAFTLNKPTAE